MKSAAARSAGSGGSSPDPSAAAATSSICATAGAGGADPVLDPARQDARARAGVGEPAVVAAADLGDDASTATGCRDSTTPVAC